MIRDQILIMLRILKQKPNELHNPVLDALRADLEAKLKLLDKALPNT